MNLLIILHLATFLECFIFLLAQWEWVVLCLMRNGYQSKLTHRERTRPDNLFPLPKLSTNLYKMIINNIVKNKQNFSVEIKLTGILACTETS